MAIVNLQKELDKGKLEALVEIYGKINKLEFEGMLEFLIHQTIETLGVKRCGIFEVFPEPEGVALVAGEPKDEHEGHGKRRYAMGDKGKKDKDKGRKQKINKQEQKAKGKLAKQPRRTP